MAFGPIAGLLLVAGCLAAVNSSRLVESRWRYLLAVPLLATTGLSVVDRAHRIRASNPIGTPMWESVRG
jgi:hypothetical protein